MNRHALNDDAFLRPRFLVHLDSLHLVQSSIDSFEDFAKDGVLAIEMRSRLVADEELRAVGVRAFISHAEDATGVMSKSRLEFVFEEFPIDGFAPFALARWIRRASLDHEVVNTAVEVGAMIAATGA